MEDSTLFGPDTTTAVGIEFLVGGREHPAAVAIAVRIVSVGRDPLLVHHHGLEEVGMSPDRLSATGGGVVAFAVFVVTKGEELVVARRLELAVRAGRATAGGGVTHFSTPGGGQGGKERSEDEEDGRQVSFHDFFVCSEEIIDRFEIL